MQQVGKDDGVGPLKRRATVGVALLLVGGLSVAGFAADASEAATKRTTTRKRTTVKRATTTRPTIRPSTTQPATSRPAPTSAVATITTPAGLALSVSTRDEVFVDNTRSTAATATAAEKPSRTLPTLIVAPDDRSRTYPLFVFGHGLGGRPAQYEQLLRRIASAGYVVAAPTFPLSNTDAPGGPNLFDQPNQAADMSFVITKMLADKQVDAEQVFAGGHSLGGITTVDLIGSSSRFDRRIDGAVVVSGTANLFSSERLFRGTPSIKVLFLHGELDATVPINLGRATFATALAPKWFITVRGGNHTFGIDKRPDLALEAGLLYTDAITSFLRSAPEGAAQVTATLEAFAAVRKDRLTMQSVVA